MFCESASSKRRKIRMSEGVIRLCAERADVRLWSTLWIVCERCLKSIPAKGKKKSRRKTESLKPNFFGVSRLSRESVPSQFAQSVCSRNFPRYNRQLRLRLMRNRHMLETALTNCFHSSELPLLIRDRLPLRQE